MSQSDVTAFLSKDKKRWFSMSEMAKKVKSKSLALSLKKLTEWEMIRRKKDFPPNNSVKRKVYLYRWKK